MSLSASESTLLVVPGWGMHVPPPHARLNAATPETVIGPVKVPVPAAQFTAKRQNCTVVLVMLIKRFGSFAGGKVEPSRSAGCKLAPALVVTQACRAAPPANIWARSKAQTWLPMKVAPLRNML